MRFQADAHVSRQMVAMLRGHGHDCLDHASIPIAKPDVDVLRDAAADGRIVITSDKDFGELVFSHRIETPGVVLLRVDLPAEADRILFVESVLQLILQRLPGSFITVTLGGVRARPINPL